MKLNTNILIASAVQIKLRVANDELYSIGRTYEWQAKEEMLIRIEHDNNVDKE